METEQKKSRQKKSKAGEWQAHGMPLATMAVRAAGRRKRDIVPKDRGGRLQASNIEVEIGDGGEMLEALARDAGLLDGGGTVKEVAARVSEKWAKITHEGDEKSVGVKCLGFLVDWACGMRHKEALAKNGVGVMEVNVMRNKSKEFRKMYEAAENGRLASAMPSVIDSAIELAVDGEPEPIFDREGNVVAERRRRDVRAIELLLKAGDKRFARGGSGEAAAAGGVTYNISLPTVVLPPPEQRKALGKIEAGETRVIDGGGLVGAEVVGVGEARAERLAALPDID